MQFAQTLLAFIYFSGLGFASTLLLQKDISLTVIMQIFSILGIALLASSKFIFPKIKNTAKIYVTLLALAPGILLIYFLVLTTNLIYSPFIILTHFFALGLAFLISPQIAVSYIIATFLILTSQLTLNQTLVPLILKTPQLALLYSMSYLGLIPFSYILAKEYKFKEEWANILEKQIVTSQNQEEQLLKSINEAVIVLDKDLNLIYTNEKAKLMFKNANIGQNFYKAFTIKDYEGRDIYEYSLPFLHILTSKLPEKIPGLQFSSGNKSFTKVDLSIIPAITAEGPLGLILVIADKSAQDIAKTERESTSSIVIGRFLTLLEQHQKELQSIAKIDSTTYRELSDQNNKIGNLANDFVYAIKLESGEIGALTTLVDLGQVLQQVYYEQKSHAVDFGLKLALPNEESGKNKFKTGIKVIARKRLFEETYVLGNEDWIKGALSKIFTVCFLACTKNSTVSFSLQKDGDLAKIVINCPKLTILPSQTPQLFEKFYANLSNSPQFASGSGLEGYIAKNLLSKMGASVNFQTAEKSPNVNAVITFGAQKEQGQETGSGSGVSL